MRIPQCGAGSAIPDTHPRVVHVTAASPLLLAAATPTGLLVSRNGGARLAKHQRQHRQGQISPCLVTLTDGLECHFYLR
jgi:hypothetical protein